MALTALITAALLFTLLIALFVDTTFDLIKNLDERLLRFDLLNGEASSVSADTTVMSRLES